jgi:hypothetical protein
MSELTVRPVEGPRDLDTFIGLPWTIYTGETLWVPPLRKDVKKLLSPEHPFWAKAEGRLFLAERDGRAVGRIAAIMDRALIEYRRELAGAWGFFECENDTDTARALFEAARLWCASKGLTFLRGPFNPSTNYEIGMLIQGFDLPPAVMMPYNPSYYPALVEDCGLVKEKDLYAFRFRRGHQAPQWALDLSRRLRERGEVTIRHVNKADLLAEIRLVAEIYQEAWGSNWGFVPMSLGEMEVMAKDLLPILDEDLGFFLYVDGAPAGVGLILPDVNPLLKRLDGRIGLTGLFKFLRYKSEITGTRALLFGVKPRFQQMGVPLVAMDYLLELQEKKQQYDHLEMSWILEDNEAINGFLRECGGELYKTYRIYRQDC